MTALPWYRRVRRWAQTNLTEQDPQNYNVAFWRQRWRQTKTQGVIVNAGGIVAFYPSHVPHHYRAAGLGERDLFGEIVSAAREDGLAVLARMDSNRALPSLYAEHPGWFACNKAGEPVLSDGRYQACVRGGYYREYLPQVFLEICKRYQPDGFCDNSWTGVGRWLICHCPACAAAHQATFSSPLPSEHNWDSPTFRRWIRWSYQARTELWLFNNRSTQAYGGIDCLWVGMVHSEPVSGHMDFADLVELGAQAPILLTDQQSRTAVGFAQNAHAGKLLHEVSSWNTLIPESMALYQRGPQPRSLAYRLCATPPEEARHWMRAGFAGGITPWWHVVGAGQDDRRRLTSVDELMAWHAQHEGLLHNREPIALAGLVWSQANTDFYGRDQATERVLDPYHGWLHALTRARLPWLPVATAYIRRQIGRLGVLILPELRVLDNDTLSALEEFCAAGGGLVISGRLGGLDGDGAPATANQLERVERLCGVAFTGEVQPPNEPERAHNSLLRLHSASRQLALSKQRDTDILPCSGRIQVVEAWSNTQVAATWIPPFAGYPPEFAWMRQADSHIPVLLLRDQPGAARVALCTADLDRRYNQHRLPDHGDVLTALVRWAAHDRLPLRVEGPGAWDVHLYRQAQRWIVHLLNLTATQAWPGALEEILPVGPLSITLLDLPPVHQVSCAVSTAVPTWHQDGNSLQIGLASVTGHELVVIE
jgi:hypothetical protein